LIGLKMPDFSFVALLLAGSPRGLNDFARGQMANRNVAAEILMRFGPSAYAGNSGIFLIR
jgi:hypothetical protein